MGLCELEPRDKAGELYSDRMKPMGKTSKGRKGVSGPEGLKVESMAELL